MGDKTNISWCDSTWNPIRGCSVVSAGCKNCYAMQVAARFSGAGLAYEGLAYSNASGAHWTGEVAIIGEHADDPVRWKQPRRIFVNSMSDLFHKELPDHAIDDIFATMALAPHHTYQILTKRAERMFEYMSDPSRRGEIMRALSRESFSLFTRKGRKMPPGYSWDSATGKVTVPEIPWPLPYVWMGVSAEDQETFQERWGYLRKTPAAVRWLSLEPLLEPIDTQSEFWEDLDEFVWPQWVVIGGESGRGHREMPLAGALDLVDQFRTLRCPVWVKQDSGPKPGLQGRIPDSYWVKEFPR